MSWSYRVLFQVEFDVLEAQIWTCCLVDRMVVDNLGKDHQCRPHTAMHYRFIGEDTLAQMV
jgi:hypothetical protein